MKVPCSVDDARGVASQSDDGDLDEQQVVFEEALLQLLLLLHQEVHLQLLKASSSGIDQRHGSDFFGGETESRLYKSKLGS